MFSFESSARKDLARSLTQAGATKGSQAVGEIEQSGSTIPSRSHEEDPRHEVYW